MMRLCLIASVLFLTATASASLSISVLQPPDGRTLNSVSISRNGAHIVTTSLQQNAAPQIHRYASTTLDRTDLGSNQGARYGVFRHAISDDGQTIAFERVIGITSQQGHTYRWRNGVFSAIRDTNQMLDESASPTDMSSNGNRIFGIGPDFFGQHEVWLSVNGATGSYINSGPVGGPGPSVAACTADGLTAVWSENLTNTSYLYQNSSVQTISNGARWLAISASGNTLAGRNGNRILTWDRVAGAPVDRGLIGSGAFMSVSHVSADGSLVLGTRGDFNTRDAWIWSPSTGILSLSSYAQSMGIDLTGWSRLWNVDMSDDRLTFAGMGQYQGSDAAFVLTIPAPAPFVLFLFANFRRRRQVRSVNELSAA